MSNLGADFAPNCMVKCLASVTDSEFLTTAHMVYAAGFGKFEINQQIKAKQAKQSTLESKLSPSVLTAVFGLILNHLL